MRFFSKQGRRGRGGDGQIGLLEGQGGKDQHILFGLGWVQAWTYLLYSRTHEGRAMIQHLESLGSERRYRSNIADLQGAQRTQAMICADSPKQEPASPQKAKVNNPNNISYHLSFNPTSKSKEFFLIKVILLNHHNIHNLILKSTYHPLKFTLYLLPFRHILVFTVHILCWIRLNPNGLVITLSSIKQSHMLENLNRNGSFIQRRKMYVQFPFHNLASKVPIDWASDPQADLMRNPCRSQKIHEQAYLQRIYDQRISKKLMDKYKNSFDTFRVMPSQATLLGKDRDALTMQLQQFNTSKVQEKAGKNIEESKQIYGGGAYNSMNELPSQKYLSKQDVNSRIGGQYSHQPQKIARNNQANPQMLGLAQKYKDPYTAQRQFTNDLMKQYRRAAQLPNSPENQQFRNLLPDKLESFLRQRQRVERKSKLRASLSLSTRNNP